jgi:cholesterol transport system auxiliary component
MTVLIDRISAPRGLAGARIALQNDDAIAYMANAVWISPAPSMLESLIGQVIDAEAPILASARAEDGLETQYELDLLLRNFEAVYDQGDNRAPLARVAIQARLIDRDARELIATREFTSSRRAGDNRQGAIVDAFSEASTQNAFELADWLTSNLCERNRQIEACS